VVTGSGLSRSGHTFAGWNTAADGSGDAYGAGAALTITGNTTLYAQWANTYTVTYQANGGTGTIATATKAYGIDLTLADGAGFSRMGHTFAGWNTAHDGSGDAYAANGAYSANAAIALYAQWTLLAERGLLGTGRQREGQLGNGIVSIQAVAKQIMTDGVQAVAAGSGHSLILKADGSLWAMGGNSYGQLGDGTTMERSAPMQILASGVQAVAAGGSHSLILKTDGSLWAMGDNHYGQLGDGSTTNRNLPTQILPSGVQAVAAGDSHSLIMKTDGSLWAMG
jgi:uncharacterized repeat protein (TIGR02543 family)